jgi:hypothetical protein
MVHRTYYGLGPREHAVVEFEKLTPHAQTLIDLQGECAMMSADYMAMLVALNGLETAAYHFTRRPHFYHQLRDGAERQGDGNGRLSDRTEAIKAFLALEPYNARLRALQGGCRPFGRDYAALEIARQCLDTAAYHFTREASFYGLRGDGAGPTRPPLL